MGLLGLSFNILKLKSFFFAVFCAYPLFRCESCLGRRAFDRMSDLRYCTFLFLTKMRAGLLFYLLSFLLLFLFSIIFIS